MIRTNLWMTGAALAGAMAIGCGKGGGSAEAAPPKAATPEEAVNHLITAVQKKDAKALVAVLAEKPRKSAQALVDLVAATTVLKGELAAKKIDLGADAGLGMTTDMLFEEMGKLEPVGKPETKDGKTTVRIKTTGAKEGGKPADKEETCQLVKEGDAWKIYPPGWTEEGARFADAFFGKMKESCDKVLAGLKNGTIKTKEDVLKAVGPDDGK